MHRVRLISMLLCALAPPLAWSTGDLSISRPINVTEACHSSILDVTHALYRWTGSYYNGTTTIEFNYEAVPDCLNYQKNGTITREFQTVYAVVPAFNSSSAVNPVNMIWTMWPQNYNIVSDDGWKNYIDVNSSGFGDTKETMKWYLASLNVFADFDDPTDEFPVTMFETKGDYYSASGFLANTTLEDLGYFDIPACNGSATEQGYIYTRSYSWTKDRNSGLDFQFDSNSANATFHSHNGNLTRENMIPLFTSNSSVSLYGSMKMAMGASIDHWHSDILVCGGDRPSWNLTVGYDEDYYGYSSDAATNMLSCSRLAAALGVMFFSTTFFLF